MKDNPTWQIIHETFLVSGQFNDVVHISLLAIVCLINDLSLSYCLLLFIFPLFFELYTLVCLTWQTSTFFVFWACSNELIFFATVSIGTHVVNWGPLIRHPGWINRSSWVELCYLETLLLGRCKLEGPWDCGTMDDHRELRRVCGGKQDESTNQFVRILNWGRSWPTIPKEEYQQTQETDSLRFIMKTRKGLTTHE